MRNPSTLPDLDTDYSLSHELVTSYSEDGFAMVRGLASAAEMTIYRKAILDAVIRYNTETRPLSERDTYGKAFLQVMNLWTKDEAARNFTLARRFAKVAAELMGVPGVRLYHDQALFKEPGGGHTPWHQDGFYWPVDQTKAVTMWMPMVDISEVMGSMTFAVGSNRDGLVPVENEISDDSEAFFDRYVSEKGYTLSSGGGDGGGRCDIPQRSHPPSGTRQRDRHDARSDDDHLFRRSDGDQRTDEQVPGSRPRQLVPWLRPRRRGVEHVESVAISSLGEVLGVGPDRRAAFSGPNTRPLVYPLTHQSG